MGLQIAGKAIERVSIIDDDEGARESYRDPIEDLGVESSCEAGPLPELLDFVSTLRNSVGGALCDYRLRIRNYASFNGDALAEELYRQQVPVVLCSSFADAEVTLMRSRRRYIPMLLKPSEVQPDNIIQGFERCIEEFGGEFQPDRRPWRTVLRFEELVREAAAVQYYYVVIPGWNPKTKIRLYPDELPPKVQAKAVEGKRYFVHVNIGSESHGDLYIVDWEVD